MNRDWQRDFVAACMVSAMTTFTLGCQREAAARFGRSDHLPVRAVFELVESQPDT